MKTLPRELVAGLLLLLPLMSAGAEDESGAAQDKQESQSLAKVKVPVKDIRSGSNIKAEEVDALAIVMSAKFDGLVFALQLNGKSSNPRVPTSSDNFDSVDNDAFYELEAAARRIKQETGEFVAILVTDSPTGKDQMGVYHKSAKTSTFTSVTAKRGGFEDAAVDAGLEAIDIVKRAKKRLEEEGSTQEPGAEAGEKESYSKKEAYRASTEKIILHYGEGIKGADLIANILNERGYPAEAAPGGPEDGVTVFALRTGGRREYSQEELNEGTLAVHAMGAYDTIKEKRAKADAPEKSAQIIEPTEIVYTKKEAYRASTERIILHYGEGIRGVEEIAFILNERGYPAEAARGGPENGVNIFALRGVGKHTYNQDQVFGGELADNAMGAYDAVMEKRAETHDAKDTAGK